jgi:hypothetical protein
MLGRVVGVIDEEVYPFAHDAQEGVPSGVIGRQGGEVFGAKEGQKFFAEGSEVSFCGAMGARERARRARREREARQRRKEKERFHPSLCKDKKVGSLPSFFRIPFPLLT